MSKIHESIKLEISKYARHMSIEAAARKVKINRLGRHDDLIDEVMKKLAG